jgi:cobalt-zinc-cadmium efflux system outer membrane protein
MPDPRLSFSVQKSPERHVAINGGTPAHGSDPMDAQALSAALPGMTEYMMTLGQEIPWPGKRAAKENMALQNAKMLDVSQQGTALALESNILASCLDLMVTKAKMDLVASQMGYWAATEKIIKAKLDQGGSSTLEAIQAMQEQSRLKLRALELEVQLQDQCDRINELTARAQNTPIEINASILGLELPKPLLADDIAADLKNRNTEWLASGVEIKGADANVQMARLDRFPDLMVAARAAKANGMPIGWMLEAGVSIPLWSGRKQNKEVARAQLMRGAAESGQKGLALAIDAASRERARSWKLAYDTAKMYETELIPQGEATLEILIAKFQTGGASFGDMVDAIKELLNDQELRLDAMAQVHNMAIQQHGAMFSK